MEEIFETFYKSSYHGDKTIKVIGSNVSINYGPYYYNICIPSVILIGYNPNLELQEFSLYYWKSNNSENKLDIFLKEYEKTL
jgi:hypothetical protein